jgi:hypothetical protein
LTYQYKKYSLKDFGLQIVLKKDKPNFLLSKSQEKGGIAIMISVSAEIRESRTDVPN